MSLGTCIVGFAFRLWSKARGWEVLGEVERTARRSHLCMVRPQVTYTVLIKSANLECAYNINFQCFVNIGMVGGVY